MFAVSCASFLFIMTSSISGMPISGTHTVIGALLGAGIMTTEMHNPFRWHKLGGILFYWFASPLCGAVIAFVLMLIVSDYTLNTRKYSFTSRIYAMQCISGLCISMVAVIIQLTVFADRKLDRSCLYIMLIALVVGVMLSRLLLLIAIGSNTIIQSKDTAKWTYYTLMALFVPCKTDFFEYLCLSVNVKPT